MAHVANIPTLAATPAVRALHVLGVCVVLNLIARGVGMLSYRSPVGLDQRFGRGWFKPAGATLGDRGVFNIESWLRHHGKRAVKRFDPYTYLLFSRAMDLHDVGRDRGGLVAAVDKQLFWRQV